MGDEIEKQKAQWINQCQACSIILDDGTTASNLEPTAVAMQACEMGTFDSATGQYDFGFKWSLDYIGQWDHTRSEEGVDFFGMFIKLFGATLGILDSVVDSIVAVCTDGAAKMRGDVASPTGPPTDKVINTLAGGKSFVARVQRYLTFTSANELPVSEGEEFPEEPRRCQKCCAPHCFCHLWNLCMGDAVKEALPKRTLDFLRMLCTKCKKSAKRTAQFERNQAVAQKVAEDLGGSLNRFLKMNGVHTKRWNGMGGCCEKCLNNMPAFILEVDRLIAAGFVAPFDNADGAGSGSGSGGAAAAPNTTIVAVADDDDDDDDDTYADIPAFNDGDHVDPLVKTAWPTVAKNKQDKMLDPIVGAWQGNFGRVSYLYDVCRIFEIPSVFAQNSLKPIGHDVSKKVRRALDAWESKFCKESPDGKAFGKWKSNLTQMYSTKGDAEQKEAAKLIKLLNAECKNFASSLCQAVKRRVVAPYFEFYDGLAASNPFCEEAIWESGTCKSGVKLLCGLWSLDSIDVWDELDDVRNEVKGLGSSEKAKADDNLLDFLNDHVMANPTFWQKRPNARKFIRNSFATAVTSHFVESLFSLMAYATGDRRSRTTLVTWGNRVHCKSTKRVTADALVGSIAQFQLAFDGGDKRSWDVLAQGGNESDDDNGGSA